MWQLLGLKAGNLTRPWQILRAATSGTVVGGRWQLLRLAVQAISSSTLTASQAAPYEPGQLVTITATRGGPAPASRVWRVAAVNGVTGASSAAPALTVNADVCTLSAPISATDASVVVGYKPVDGPEVFITIPVYRSTHWVRWSGSRRPAAIHIVSVP